MKLKAISLFLLCLTLFSCKTSEEKKEPVSKESEEVVKDKLTVVGEFQFRPGNVAVSGDGLVFATMHPLGKSQIQLVQVHAADSIVPFPNMEYQKNGAEASDATIDSPLGIRVDKKNRVWIIDMGQNLGKTRLFAFDSKTGEEVFKFELPTDLAPAGSFIQDLAVDEKNGWAYLADIANPGILAVDLEQGTVRRFADSTVVAEDIDMIIDDKLIYFGGEPSRVAVNPITLSNDRETLYYGAMSGTKWYGVPTKLFREGAEDSEISAAVTIVGDKPISDGVATDAQGNHYFTNLQEHGLDLLTPKGELTPLIRDKRILWADNVSVDNQGGVYFTVNQLHLTPAFTGAEDLGVPPYYIYKLNL